MQSIICQRRSELISIIANIKATVLLMYSFYLKAEVRSQILSFKYIPSTKDRNPWRVHQILLQLRYYIVKFMLTSPPLHFHSCPHFQYTIRDTFFCKWRMQFLYGWDNPLKRGGVFKLQVINLFLQYNFIHTVYSGRFRTIMTVMVISEYSCVNLAAL